MTNFLPRLITGIVYISIVAGSILYSSKSFTLIFSLLMLIAFYESNQLWKKIRLINTKYKYPIPQAYVGLSMTTLIFLSHEISAFIFLGLIGISNGFANVLGSSTWAEIYGVKYIGSIKALSTSLMVFFAL